MYSIHSIPPLRNIFNTCINAGYTIILLFLTSITKYASSEVKVRLADGLSDREGRVEVR